MELYKLLTVHVVSKLHEAPTTTARFTETDRSAITVSNPLDSVLKLIKGIMEPSAIAQTILNCVCRGSMVLISASHAYTPADATDEDVDEDLFEFWLDRPEEDC